MTFKINHFFSGWILGLKPVLQTLTSKAFLLWTVLCLVFGFHPTRTLLTINNLHEANGSAIMCGSETTKPL